nr:hypothetical protein [Pseudomonas toyotomiensis]
MKSVLYFRITSSGEQIILTDAPVTPLGLEDLISFEQNSEFKISIQGASIHNPDEPETRKLNISADFSTSHTNQCFALVNSGWLPPIFALPNSLILADRNIISDISKRFRQGELAERDTDQPDFFDFTATFDYKAKISLAPFALEGNSRRIPTRQEVIKQLEEAERKVHEALPKLETIPITPTLVDGIMGVIADSQDYFERRLKFLTSCIHILCNTAGKTRRHNVWKQIAEYADAANLPKTDICVIAAISSATASGSCNPARGILKPKHHYTENDAYNALCDLRLLSLLIHFIHDFPSQKAVLLTKDINLAKFWCGIGTLVTSRQTPLVSCQFKIHPLLFPLDSDSASELQAILEPSEQ